MLRSRVVLGSLVAAGWVVLLSASDVSMLVGQNSPCRTDDPDAGYLVGTLRHLYGDSSIDSTYWHQVGFPYATGAAIQLATKHNVCSAAVTAFNAQTGASVSSVYVALIGNTGYVVMSPPTQAGKVTVLYWFDTSWVFRQAMAG